MGNEALDKARNMTGREFCAWLEAKYPDLVRRQSTGVFLSNQVVGKPDTYADRHSSIFVSNQFERAGFYRFSSGESGDAIDCLKKFFNMSFKEAVESLSGERVDVREIPGEYRDFGIDEPPRELVLPKREDTPLYTVNYLTRRGISLELMNKLMTMDLLYETKDFGKYSNVVFVNEAKTFAQKRSVFGRYIKTMPGTKYGSWWEFQSDSSKPVSHVMVAEAPIDAMSLCELYAKQGSDFNPAFCAMAGLKPKVFENIIEKNMGKEVILAVDNDKAGDNFCDRFPGYKRIVPTGKDWNEDLVKGNTVDLEPRIHIPAKKEKENDRLTKRKQPRGKFSYKSKNYSSKTGENKNKCSDKRSAVASISGRATKASSSVSRKHNKNR